MPKLKLRLAYRPVRSYGGDDSASIQVWELRSYRSFITMNPVAEDIPLATKVSALRECSAYSHVCLHVQIIETHFAWVFLAGEYAYKMKKPVQIERMDFRTALARERNCREELRLNKRLASEVYLDVVPLTLERDGALEVGGVGTPVDWLVMMRRLPEQRLLDTALATQTVNSGDVHSVAKLLAEFYRDEVPVLFSGADYLARLHARIDDTEEQLLAADLRLNADVVELASARQKTFLAHNARVFQDRTHDGRIIEGHGDLRPEHVFLGSEPGATPKLLPCIIDCLEFDRDLRVLDPLEELAFLALECGRLNASWVADEFVATYRTTTADNFSPELFQFYRSARALNRAKIAAWHVRDPAVATLADWRALADSYLHNSLEAAEFGD